MTAASNRYNEKRRKAALVALKNQPELLERIVSLEETVAAMHEEMAAMKYDIITLKAHAANYDALDQENRRLATLVEKLKAQLENR